MSQGGDVAVESQPDGKRTASRNARQAQESGPDDDSLTVVSTLESESRKNRRKEEMRRQYFQEELKRLQKNLQKESSRIHDPGPSQHIPYVFNSLVPYYDTHLVQEIVDKPATKPKEYQTRNTAIGLVDPWVNHNMDKTLLPTVRVPDPKPFRPNPKKEKKQGHGSTIIPNFPTIKLETKDLETKPLAYSDVAMLREEVRQRYSSQAQDKIAYDYENTKNDFYRMELHKLCQVHPINRKNMRKTYFAYLQNSPGSKKALKECVKMVDEELGTAETRSQNGDKDQEPSDKDEKKSEESKPKSEESTPEKKPEETKKEEEPPQDTEEVEEDKE